MAVSDQEISNSAYAGNLDRVKTLVAETPSCAYVQDKVRTVRLVIRTSVEFRRVAFFFFSFSFFILIFRNHLLSLAQVEVAFRLMASQAPSFVCSCSCMLLSTALACTNC